MPARIIARLIHLGYDDDDMVLDFEVDAGAGKTISGEELEDYYVQITLDDDDLDLDEDSSPDTSTADRIQQKLYNALRGEVIKNSALTNPQQITVQGWGGKGKKGSDGPQGPQGPKGLRFYNTWNKKDNYEKDDVITWDGTIWIATTIIPGNESNNEPDNDNRWNALTSRNPKWQGAWNDSQQYHKGDVVRYLKRLWIATERNKNFSPPTSASSESNDKWSVFSKDGEDGLAGPEGGTRYYQEFPLIGTLNGEQKNNNTVPQPATCVGAGYDSISFNTIRNKMTVVAIMPVQFDDLPTGCKFEFDVRSNNFTLPNVINNNQRNLRIQLDVVRVDSRARVSGADNVDITTLFYVTVPKNDGTFERVRSCGATTTNLSGYVLNCADIRSAIYNNGNRSQLVLRIGCFDAPYQVNEVTEYCQAASLKTKFQRCLDTLKVKAPTNAQKQACVSSACKEVCAGYTPAPLSNNNPRCKKTTAAETISDGTIGITRAVFRVKLPRNS